MKKLFSSLIMMITFSTIFTITSGINTEASVKITKPIATDIHINSNEKLRSFAHDFNRGKISRNCNIFLDTDVVFDESIEPIGTGKNPFCGVFDGNFNNLKYNLNSENSSCALFGCTNEAVIKNIFTEGNLKVAQGASIVLFAYKTNICNCINFANIDSNISDAAGIALFAKDCIIFNCKNSGSICSFENVGGIVCIANNCDISCCTNLGPLSCSYGFSGGIISVALASTKVEACDNKGEMSFCIRDDSYEYEEANMIKFLSDIEKATNNYKNNNYFYTRKFVMARKIVALPAEESVEIHQANKVMFFVGISEIEK